MSGGSQRVCPVERAGGLDNRLRRWVHNPQKILGPYVKEGMTVMDVGCGPGLYAIEMAMMVGESGRVFATDLQEGMLGLLRSKIQGSGLEQRITPHKCERTKIGVSVELDFVLAFYMVHELPDQAAFFTEIEATLKGDGRLLIIEPPFHVSKSAFDTTMEKACDAGLTLVDRPKVLLSKTALLRKS